jgi:hypothetical protein
MTNWQTSGFEYFNRTDMRRGKMGMRSLAFIAKREDNWPVFCLEETVQGHTQALRQLVFS